MNKLPGLNSSVYIITWIDSKPACISKDKVYMKNKDSFITKDMLSDDFIEEYRHPRSINDYGYGWTRTLEEAKQVVKNYAEDNDLICRFDKAMGDALNIGLWRRLTNE